MTEKKIKAYKKGLWSEFLATIILRLKGYRIVAQRYKCKAGEIDIIGLRRGALVFVEVKAREEQGQALESVTFQNRSRVERAAQYFLSFHPEYASYDLRFDVITFSPPFLLSHLDNAWRPRT